MELKVFYGVFDIWLMEEEHRVYSQILVIFIVILAEIIET